MKLKSMAIMSLLAGTLFLAACKDDGNNNPNPTPRPPPGPTQPEPTPTPTPTPVPSNDLSFELNGTKLVNGSTVKQTDIHKIVAVPKSTLGEDSVVFYLNGSQVRIENGKPYAMHGDNGEDLYKDSKYKGSQTLTVRAFKGPNGTGAELASIAIQLNVMGVSTPAPTPVPTPPPSVPGLVSFPGALGYGAIATGGRGGRVLRVTNGNDSGEGSLRWAIDQKGPRIIVFDGVNRIKITSKRLAIMDGDVTIAGQTAGGVEVEGEITIRAENVIIRGMAFRYAYDPLQVLDAHRVIIDRCSIYWGIDETASIVAENKTTSNITLSNSIIAEGLSYHDHGKGEHSKGLLVREGPTTARTVTGVTIYGNLFAHNRRRNPWMQAGKKLEVINNYVYAPGSYGETMHFGAPEFPNRTQVNVINNVVQVGQDSYSTDNSAFWIRDPGGYFYLSGNVQYGLNGQPLGVPFARGPNVDRVNQTTPVHSGSGIDAIPASQVPAYVLATVGMNAKNRDATDQRLIDQVKNKTGKMLDDPKFRPMPTPVKHVDTDKDGMPDFFEDANGLNKNVDDSAGDKDGDGYTNIEEYINSLF